MACPALFLLLLAAQVWEQAQKAGLKSKRFTKQMLHQLKDAGWVKTQPLHASGSGKKQRSHGYRLNPKRQEERRVTLEGRARRAGQARAAAARAAAT